jgi:exonuclease VII small subunit
MSITTDARKYGETVLEQGKVALDEARKPWYAAVGATDLAYGQIRTQVKELPAETQARLRRLQSGVTQLDADRLRAAVDAVTSQARGVYGAYALQVRSTYETLARRGETVVGRLRRSPQVRSAFDRTEELLEGAEDVVETAEQAVERAEEKVTKPARKAPARKGSVSRT